MLLEIGDNNQMRLVFFSLLCVNLRIVEISFGSQSQQVISAKKNPTSWSLYSKSEENFADITCENEIERERERKREEEVKETFSALATN